MTFIFLYFYFSNATLNHLFSIELFVPYNYIPCLEVNIFACDSYLLYLFRLTMDSTANSSQHSPHNSTRSSTRGVSDNNSVQHKSDQNVDAQTTNFGFLCQNVRFLNQPICSLIGDQNKVDHKRQFVAQNVSFKSTNTSDEKPQTK